MILTSFTHLLAGIYPLATYPPNVTNNLEKHFSRELEASFSLNPVSTRGATKTYYYHLVLPDGEYFVKWGEKVTNEIQCQKRFETSETPFAPLSKGTSEEKGVLVRPVLSEPNFGYDVVDQLYKKGLSLEKFLKSQDEILDRVAILYRSSSPSQSRSKLFTVKLQERMSALLTDPSLDSFLEKADLAGLNRKDLFNMPILYQGKQLPSINQMATEFATRFEKIPELKNKYLVHGDMHAPNIAKDRRYGIVLIDLSDLKANEDPCWDLGKWLNHIHRLHPVVQKRESLGNDRDITIKKSDRFIELTDATVYPQGLGEIDAMAISKIAKVINEPVSLVRVRAKAAEFVVNINTMKRHIEQYPMIAKRLLCVIAESYIAWSKDADRYFSEETPSK